MNGNISLIQRGIAKAFYWKMAVWKGIVGVIIVGCSTAIASLPAQDWIPANKLKIILFFMGIFMAVVKAVDMLLDQTIARLKQDQPPDNSGMVPQPPIDNAPVKP